MVTWGVACEDIGAGAHGAANEYRLPRELVVNGYEGVVGREGARAALAVHQQLLQLPLHQVLLHLKVQKQVITPLGFCHGSHRQANGSCQSSIDKWIGSSTYRLTAKPERAQAALPLPEVIAHDQRAVLSESPCTRASLPGTPC